MAVGLFAIMSVDLVDAFWIAMLGKDELAAIGFAAPVTSIFLSIGIGFSTGASLKLAQFLGRADSQKERAKCFVMEMLIVAVAFTSCCVVLGISTIDPLFGLLGASGNVLVNIHDYMSIWYIGIVMVVVPMLGNGFIRATGAAVWPAIIMVAASILNAALDPLLMFGWGFIPPMGIQGAALATVIVRTFACVAIIGVLDRQYRLIYWHLPKWSSIKNSVRIVLPTSVSSTFSFVILPFAHMIVVGFIATIGNTEVAGFNIGLRIEFLALVLSMAISASCAPIIAQNFGAKDFQRLSSIRNHVYAIALLVALPIGIIVMVFAQPLSLAFGEHPDVQHIVVLYLFFIPLSWIGRAFSMCSVNMLSALSQPLLSVMVTIFHGLLLYVPLAFVFKYFWGFEGILSAYIIANISSGTLGWFLTRGKCRSHVSD